MNFLSSLWNGIKSTASSIGNAFNSFTNGIASTISNSGVNAASAQISAQGLNPGKPVNYNSSGQGYQDNTISAYQVPSGIQPNTPQYQQFASNPSSYTAGTSITSRNYGNGTASTTPSYDIRPSTANPTGVQNYASSPIPKASPVPNSSQQVNGGSSSQFGNGFYDVNGGYVVPTYGFSGETGGGQSFGDIAVPSQGSSGLSGGSSGTGLLGATSGLGTPSMYASPSQTEEDKKKKQQQLPAAEQAQQIAYNPALAWLYGGTPLMVKPAANTALQAGPTPATHDAGAIASSLGNNSGTLSTSYASSPNDLASTNQNLNSTYQQNRLQTAQTNPVPQNPVQDTPGQAQAIQNSPDPFGTRQAMDNYKLQNTQLGQLTTNRVNVMQQIQSITATYQGAIDEVRANPNLPKGLAIRRLEALNTSQKNVLQGHINELQLLNQSIDDQNHAVDRAFSIVQFDQGQEDKAHQNALSTLQLMVTSGAVGGFNDSDMKTFSTALGIPMTALQSMKAAANKPDLNTQVVGSSETGYFAVAIDKKTGKVVNKTPISGGTSSMSGGTSSPIANNLYQQLKTRSLDFSSLPADQKKQALAVFASKGETIPRQLTGAEKNAQQSAISGLNAIGQIQTMFEKGSLPLTRSYILGDSYAGRAAGTSQYETLKKEAADVVTRIRTGAALNESEVKFYQGLLPALGDSNSDIKLKLNQLTGFYLGMSGLPVTVTDPKTGSSFVADDLYNSQQRLGLRQALTKGYQLSY